MKNLYLIGMMGCGKSTVASMLGRALDRPVLDTDQALERRTDMTVNDIFAKKGEAFFRQLETELLWELSDREGLIVACGGGLPLKAENRAILRESGVTVFLNRDVEKIYAGLDTATRPLGREGKQAFLDRFAHREPLYRAAADLVVGDTAAPEEAVAAILEYLKKEEAL